LERLEVRLPLTFLADGWVLVGVYPLTTVAEMTEGRFGGEETIIVNQSNVHGVFLFFTS
jgi:hypothetical protein